MLRVLWIVPALPLACFLVLALGGGRLGARTVAYVGTAFVGVAAAVAVAISISFMVRPPAGHAFSQVLWTWFQVGGLAPQVALYLDPLSVVMMTVVAVVGFLILLYSVEFMRGEEGYARFFAYMNLFIGAMLMLLLADNLLLLLVGWEGVGLSSYLLIGFWYRDPANGAAARKAFIVTRVGDTSLLVGLLLIFRSLGSLNIQETMGLAQQHWRPGSGIAVAAALLILGGAMGKSAQLPLQTWLPDAMAGPTPVSALIHAATMVTAGVYLIARTHVLFDLAPAAKTAVAVIGAATLIYGGLSALAQRDIKRVLAYSTISQIGYMFLALGVGAWSAAIFHFFTHAFFKALLFLAAGLVVKALGGEHDITKMGGLHRRLRPVFWVFLMGAASLSAVPVVTAGFYSKDLILGSALSSGRGGAWLWAFGVLGAFLTSLYAFRLVFLVFFGKAGDQPPLKLRFGKLSWVPVGTLAVLAIVAGFIQLPQNWGGATLFTNFLQPALSTPQTESGGFAGSVAPQLIVVIVSLAGIYVSYLLFVRARDEWRLLAAPVRRGASVSLGGFRRVLAALDGFALAGWGFDRLYDLVFVRPFAWAARANKDDVIDSAFDGVAWSSRQANQLLSRTQTGRLRLYVAIAAAGVLVLVAIGGAPMILSLLVIIPLAGGFLAWILGRWDARWARWTALAFSLGGLGLTLAIWARHFAGAPAVAAGKWVEQTDVSWIPQLGIRFHLAVDGLSLIMLMLTFVLTALAVVSSWKGVTARVGFFHFHIMWAAAGLAGVFMALDLVLFYFFFEMMLVPLYFLIVLWGHERRVRAAIKFFIFTQVAGLLMLVAIVGLYFVHGRATGTYTFDYLQLLGTSLSSRAGFWLMFGFFVAFAVKLPALPLHSWLPDAHTEAPTAGSVILAGLLIKVGAYGMLRFMFPLFPHASFRFATIGMALGVAGILYGAVLAFAQTDLKRLVAYTSVSHMGFVLLGVFAWNELALHGVILQIVCHAFSTGGLFIMVGALEERTGTRDLGKLGGLWASLPRFGGASMVLAMAALGLPALGNFVAEFLILQGTYQVNRPAAIVAAVGLVLATVYALWLIQRVFHGRLAAEHASAAGSGRPLGDLSVREIAMMAVCVIVVLWLGLYPQTFIRTAKPSVDSLQQLTVQPGAQSMLQAGAQTALQPGAQSAIPAQPEAKR